MFNGPNFKNCGVAIRPPPRNDETMFSIEHEFDSTVITLVDEGPTPLKEDVIVNSFAECVTVQQFNTITQQTETMTLSYEQVRDLAAALDLPEGVYSLVSDGPTLRK